MEKLTRNKNTSQFPVKVIQFGEGNFLRAFVDWMIDLLNEQSDFGGSVAIVQPLEQGMVDILASQDGLYHHVCQGIENGKTIDEIRLIKSVSQVINPFLDTTAFFQLAEIPEVTLVFSNTTEAGIEFQTGDLPENGKLAHTFPGKLTQLLKHRYDHFKGQADKGLAIIPCELIEMNGTKLRECVHQYIELWGLEASFDQWVNEHCSFSNTLVDRIVPGYPKDEIESLTQRIGVKDQLIVKSEIFHLFVIEGPESVQKRFPAHLHGLNVKYVKDIQPYRTQKVRILNGAHTSMVPIGLLSDLQTVSETINDPVTGKLIHQIIFDEIVSTIEIPGEDPKEFATQIISRFQNPFIRHELMSISLNSISKFKVRVLPTILDYMAIKKELPKGLVFSFACLIQLYHQQNFSIKDDERYLDFFTSLKAASTEEIVTQVLSNKSIWEQDLTKVPGLKEQIIKHIEAISTKPIKEVILSI